jgi:hypothetical protein
VDLITGINTGRTTTPILTSNTAKRMAPTLTPRPSPTSGARSTIPNNHKKWTNGKQYYYVHVYYKWKTPDDGQWHKQGYWYYCQYHKYDDPNRSRPYFKAWVGYKPTGKHYWESFYWHS